MYREETNPLLIRRLPIQANNVNFVKKEKKEKPKIM